MLQSKLTMLSVALILGGLLTACTYFNPETSKKAAPDELFLVRKSNETATVTALGFMDRTGKIVVGPWDSYEWNGRKYGSDSFKTPYYYVLPFIEGAAGICFFEETSKNAYNDSRADLEKGKCGFIDRTGKIVIEPSYKKIGYFSDGLAAVSADGEKFGYVDKSGKLVIEQKFISKNAFHDGLAMALEPGGGQKGYIDKSGNFVIQPKFQFATNFGDGHAIVNTAALQKVIIDKTGKEIKNIETESAGNTDYYYRTSIKSLFYEGYAVEEASGQMPSFNEGLTMIYDRGRAFPVGYANVKGELEIRLDPQLVGMIRPFSEGFAPIGWRFTNEERKKRVHGYDAPAEAYDWTFIDRKGNVKVDLENTFREARPFAEGLAAVRSRAETADGRWGFVNAEFRTAVPFCFEKVSDFRGGLAAAMLVEYAAEKKGCEQYGSGSGAEARNVYIDKNGTVVKPQW